MKCSHYWSEDQAKCIKCGILYRDFIPANYPKADQECKHDHINYQGAIMHHEVYDICEDCGTILVERNNYDRSRKK